jgi:hypothetical protein
MSPLGLSFRLSSQKEIPQRNRVVVNFVVIGQERTLNA